MKKDSSWNESAGWYDQLLENTKDTYQRKVISPNLLRLLELKKGENVLDLACGNGFFTREFFKQGANVTGVDLSSKMIELARKKSASEIKLAVASADKLSFLESGTFDKVVIVLAIQNIENVSGVFQECQRVLKSRGKLFLIMNHPAFRIAKKSSWDWDNESKIQYRRIDRYLSESKVKIQTHPGDRPEEYTISFHRPLQFYFKLLQKNGFAVSHLEEWISHKQSQTGPRAEAEDLARKEIPLFMFLECIKP